MECSLVLPIQSWGAALKTAPVLPVRGPGLFAKGAQPALLTITVWVCSTLPVPAQSGSELTRAGMWWERLQDSVELAGGQLRKAQTTQAWGEEPERQGVVVVVTVLFWKPG